MFSHSLLLRRSIKKKLSLKHGLINCLSYSNRRTLASVSSQRPGFERPFDDGKFWRDCNKENYRLSQLDGKLANKLRSSFSSTELPTGLFENSWLTSPSGLREFSGLYLERANQLVELLRSDRSEAGLKAYISNLDLLSDTLCRVIDLCEFIRSAHPDERFVSAAQSCYEEMFEFMNMLNTDVDLCYTLRDVLQNEKIRSQLSEEEVTAGKILLEDFEKSGIYMESSVRQKFIDLSQNISIIGQEFISNTDYVDKNMVMIPVEDLKLDELNLQETFELKKDVSGKFYKVPTYGYIAYTVLKNCANENVRKILWTAMHSCGSQQIRRLQNLVKYRLILAKMLNKKSYSDYQLEGKMARSRKDVIDFVETLVKYTKPLAAKELQFMAEEKLNCKPLSTADILNTVSPWDRDFYLHKNQEDSSLNLTRTRQVAQYFTLGNVMNGLSDLFHSIYGVRFELSVPKVGETWDPEVRKLNVISDVDGLIGIIYCDLFEREGKTTNAAHFTISCSRQINEREIDLSSINTGIDANGNKFQLSIISLICSFVRGQFPGNKDICLLTLSEIETLFHEMGHAMHSMLGRTKLQNTSGTRCATDFVELPSILMEHFAKDPRVLQKISCHYMDGSKIPAELLQNHLEASTTLQHCETYSQAKMAMLDQVLHGDLDLRQINNIDVTSIYQDLERKLEVLPDVKSNWCGKFGHLFGYGSMYYSYLFDRAIAAKVWDKLFKKDPYNRTSGEKFSKAVLKWGGSRDPWKCIADALDKPELAKGGSDAIKYFGTTNSL